MEYSNNTMFVRYRLLTKLVSMWKHNELLEKIDSMPYEMYPRNQKPKGRCCIHKERAVIKYKTMAMLGFTMQDEVNEMDSLSSYVERMYKRDGVSLQDGVVLHVHAIPTAPRMQYITTRKARHTLTTTSASAAESVIRYAPTMLSYTCQSLVKRLAP